MDTVHYPVMCKEVVQILRATEGGSFLDCTLGGAGHTEAILNANTKNRVVALDRDSRAVERARKKLEKFDGRIELHHSPFSQVKVVVEGKVFDGMLVDLGISTDQLREQRGFSFKDETPLDMRMDEKQEFSAFDVVNHYPEKKLLTVLLTGGVGREAKAVCRAIVNARPIESTAKLSSVINKAAAGITAKKQINPSTVVFQSLRIEVNKEFEEIERLLEIAPSVVRTGGRLAVLTFHSLEDKIVTRTMRSWAQGDDTPASWRGPRKARKGKLVSQKPILPTEEEVQKNPPSRSARLRVFEFGE